MKGVRLTAQGTGLYCCFSHLFASVYVLTCGSHSPALTPFPPSPKKTKEGRDWGECHPFLFLKAWRYSVFRCIPTVYWAGQKNSFGLSYGKIQMNILANPIVWLLACREIPELPAYLCYLGGLPRKDSLARAQVGLTQDTRVDRAQESNLRLIIWSVFGWRLIMCRTLDFHAWKT